MALGVMAGVDAGDAATQKSAGLAAPDYIQYLDAGALAGARIGIARDFMDRDPEVDWIVEASLEAMRGAGATIVDVRLPDANGIDVARRLMARDPQLPMVLVTAYLEQERNRAGTDLPDRHGYGAAVGTIRASPGGSEARTWRLDTFTGRRTRGTRTSGGDSCSGNRPHDDCPTCIRFGIKFTQLHHVLGLNHGEFTGHRHHRVEIAA